mmetsp:Transcript_9647/g.39357  ORF Transcript_9647/g.39357 Transcript_9647/m.39357 type:complete len:225 (-) Transcript_9647:92-766(-)
MRARRTAPRQRRRRRRRGRRPGHDGGRRRRRRAHRLGDRHGHRHAIARSRRAAAALIVIIRCGGAPSRTTPTTPGESAAAAPGRSARDELLRRPRTPARRRAAAALAAAAAAKRTIGRPGLLLDGLLCSIGSPLSVLGASPPRAAAAGARRDETTPLCDAVVRHTALPYYDGRARVVSRTGTSPCRCRRDRRQKPAQCAWALLLLLRRLLRGRSSSLRMQSAAA